MNPADWQRGFWQANEDLKTEGDLLWMYVVASESFKQGYRARLGVIA